MSKRISKMLFSKEKVELALVQDIIRDSEIAKGQVKSLLNLAARRERDYKEVLKMAEKIGVQLDSNITEAGKYFIDLENKLK